MKKLLFLFAASVLVLCSCNKESSSEEDFVSLDEINYSRTITFNSQTKAGDNQSFDLTLNALYDVNNEVVTSLDMSSTDSNLDIDWLKNEVETQFETIYGCPIEEYCPSNIPETKGSASNCFKECNENFEKGKGRGWCKVECIVDKIVEIVEKILKAI